VAGGQVYCDTAIIHLFSFVSPLYPLCTLWLILFNLKVHKEHKEKSAIIGILQYTLFGAGIGHFFEAFGEKGERIGSRGG